MMAAKKLAREELTAWSDPASEESMVSISCKNKVTDGEDSRKTD